jgi:hypothetical protein
MSTYRPHIRKASSDSSVASDASDQSTTTSPTGSTQSMNSFTQKKAFFYIPDAEFDGDSDDDEQITFTVVTKHPKSSSSSATQAHVQSNHQHTKPDSKGKKEPRGQATLKKVSKVLDLSLLERLAQEPAKGQSAISVAKSTK